MTLTQDLNEQEQRHLREHISEEELAVFDIRPRPGPELDAGLPEKYTAELFAQKCGVLFQHVLEKYPDRGRSVCGEAG